MNCSLPLKLCEHICYNYTAFYCPTLHLIVLKQREHIPTVFHCQTTNQLLNHLDKDEHKKYVTFILICITFCVISLYSSKEEMLKWCLSMLINSITSLSLLLTSPAVVCELMDILQDPPPWQYTVVVMSCLFNRAAISSWEGTCSLVFVFFRDSPMKWAYFSISVPG